VIDRQELLAYAESMDSNNPFAEWWMALMVLLDEEELIRLRKRCSMEPMANSVLGYRLSEALTSELRRRTLYEQRPS